MRDIKECEERFNVGDEIIYTGYSGTDDPPTGTKGVIIDDSDGLKVKWDFNINVEQILDFQQPSLSA